jgi:hypothetical protein
MYRTRILSRLQLRTNAELMRFAISHFDKSLPHASSEPRS